MSANSTSLARWTDEEHQILVQLTNDQLELESHDHSQEISWAAHWRQVSVQLQESGYNRTNTACQSYWKRIVETQKANEEAAGPRWDDSEHQILLGMTEDQLALEKEDKSAVIPWPKHWKKVSLRLQESGYHRTANSCAAYWLKVGYDFSVDTHEPPERPMFPGDEVESTEENEHENVFQDEWQVEDEDGKDYEDEGGSEPNRASVGESTSPTPQAEEAQPGDFPEPKHILLSNATSVFTPTITPVPSEKDYSEDESYQPRQREPTKSKMAQTPTKAESTPPKPRSPKVPLKRGFRFTAEQREVLEAQAIRVNGCYPDGDRRMELAEELGVDEKTVRNWFVHRRSQKGQWLLANMTTPGQSAHDDSFVSEGSPAVSLSSGSKRKSLPVDSKEDNSPIGNGTERYISKKPRIMKGSSPIVFTSVGVPSGSTTPYISQNPPVAGAAAPPEPAATSMTPSLPVDITPATLRGAAQSPNLPTLDSEQQRPRVHAEQHQQSFKRSPSVPTPVPGADWNPINSAKAREPRAIVSAASTPTPAFHVLPSNGPLPSQHPYGKPVSATPPSVEPNLQQATSAAPLPRPSAGLTEIDEKQWMLSKASTLQSEVENLQRDETAWLHRLSLIDERINAVTNEENNLEEAKRTEIREAIREIEERYRGRNDYVKAQQSDLVRQRDVELAGLFKNRVDGKKKTTALRLFRDLVGLLEED
ncbi:hypothetical protein VTL71DRAFT_10191 [Oculimacula yallundae]|uniref:Homeobox domain-containing protein n=1 Tax=Oculimacula yallundae TaxID=86028 RepID=A0ABR4BQS5_9HELO